MRALIVTIAFGCLVGGGTALVTTTRPACAFNCSDNRPCENDAGCLGPCYCDLDTFECVP